MPPNNPNFGTGFVDWSTFVNANQNNINQDRGAVQSYLGNQANQLGQMPAGDAFNATQANLGTDVSALQSPGGFEQVLAQARAKYDPTAKDPSAKQQNNGGPWGHPSFSSLPSPTFKGPPSAPNDSFAAALEGQNAGELYKGQDPYSMQPKAPAASPDAPQKDPGGRDFGPPSGRPEGPMDVGPQHRQDAGPDWGSYVNNPQDYPGYHRGMGKRGQP